MLREVSLELDMENELKRAAISNGVALEVLDCKMFNTKGMSLYLEMKGETRAVRDAIADIRKLKGVRELILGEGNGDHLPLLAVLDRYPVCRAANEAAIICLECPMNSKSERAVWRFMEAKQGDLKKILAYLARQGISARIQGVTSLGQKPGLSDRQKEILSAAVSNGYFEFPRRISLTGLSSLLGVRPSTLSEILRGAERKVMEAAAYSPPHA